MPPTKPKQSPLRSPHTSFLHLPPEIRIQIYQYILVRKDPIKLQYLLIDDHRFTSQGIHDEKKSLLLVSKLIGSEASSILYGENVFQVDLCEGGQCFLRKYFSEANRRKIRRLQLVMRPQGITYGRMPDSALWSPILATLTTLSIVAQQPLPIRRYIPSINHYYNIPPPQQSMEEWMEWLRPIMKYIARRLPRDCIVEVDDDEWSETSTLMSECFPKGYRKVRVPAGDFCFMRSGCIWRSAY